MTTEEKIAVMAAAAAGKAIEMRLLSSPAKWCLTKDPWWNWQHCEYRVKPEPLECWVNVSACGTSYHTTEASARSWAKNDAPSPLRVAVHLKEVVE